MPHLAWCGSQRCGQSGRGAAASSGPHTLIAGRPGAVGERGQSHATEQVRLDSVASCRPNHGPRRQRFGGGTPATGGDHQALAGTGRQPDGSGCARQAGLPGCDQRLDSDLAERGDAWLTSKPDDAISSSRRLSWSSTTIRSLRIWRNRSADAFPQESRHEPGPAPAAAATRGAAPGITVRNRRRPVGI